MVSSYKKKRLAVKVNRVADRLLFSFGEHAAIPHADRLVGGKGYKLHTGTKEFLRIKEMLDGIQLQLENYGLINDELEFISQNEQNYRHVYEITKFLHSYNDEEIELLTPILTQIKKNPEIWNDIMADMQYLDRETGKRAGYPVDWHRYCAKKIKDFYDSGNTGIVDAELYKIKAYADKLKKEKLVNAKLKVHGKCAGIFGKIVNWFLPSKEK